MLRTKLVPILIILLTLGLTQSAVYNASCKTTKECHDIYTSQYHCKNSNCIRRPFTYDNWREICGAVIIVIISMFANAGGLGAGAVIIPVYIFIYGFAPTDSIP